jgi:hypothetical protein
LVSSGIGQLVNPDRQLTIPTAIPAQYRRVLAAFVFSFALALLALVDFRRGFLFAAYPARSVFYAFHPLQIVMLAAGAAGMMACYRRLAVLEREGGPTGAHAVKPFTFVLLALLVVDLFTYRGVPAARSIEVGRVNVDWLKRVRRDRLVAAVRAGHELPAEVWHATMLGILIFRAGAHDPPDLLQAVFRPERVHGFGPRRPVRAAAAVLFVLLVGDGAVVRAPRRLTNFLLSFVVGAPMLNVTTIVLALALLPAPFAVTRIVAGVVVGVLVTYLVSMTADRWDGQAKVRLKADAPSETADARFGADRQSGFSQTYSGWFLELLDFDRIVGGRTIDTPAQLIGAWLVRQRPHRAGAWCRCLWVWSVIASALFQALAICVRTTTWPSVIVSAIGGTLFMISTWSEIPMALQLIQSGDSGPARALLVVLPAISLPCMVMLGRDSLQRFHMAGDADRQPLMIVGIVAGGDVFCSGFTGRPDPRNPPDSGHQQANHPILPRR